MVLIGDRDFHVGATGVFEKVVDVHGLPAGGLMPPNFVASCHDLPGGRHIRGLVCSERRLEITDIVEFGAALAAGSRSSSLPLTWR